MDKTVVTDSEEKFWKKLSVATSLRKLPDSAPLLDENSDEDWEPEILLYQQKASQELLQKQAKKRCAELFRDVHTRTRLRRWTTFKILRLDNFLLSPLLRIVEEENEETTDP